MARDFSKNASTCQTTNRAISASKVPLIGRVTKAAKLPRLRSSARRQHQRRGVEVEAQEQFS